VIETFAQFCRWLLLRAVIGCALAALALAAWAWRMQTQDGGADFQTKRAELLSALAEQRARAQAGAADARKHADDLQAQARAQEQAADDAAREVETHKALESSWQRWFGDREQQEVNDKLLAEAGKKQASASAGARALKKELADFSMARERANIEVARIDARIQSLEKISSKWEYHARAAWERGRIAALAIVVLWILWTPVSRAFSYYLVAPFIVRRKALRLTAPLKREEGVEQITTTDSGRTLTIALGANEVLRVKPELVESADAGLARRDGRRLATTGAKFPLAKKLCRLTRLAEFQKPLPHPTPPPPAQPAPEDTATRMVNLRGMGKWKGDGPDLRKRRAELVMVLVPRGASLSLRPRYLAGAVSEAGGAKAGGAGNAPLAVRAHWRVFNWHAWVTGQFRFFEFAGPCRLIVAGQRGARVEWIEEREDGLRPVARVEPWALMGFDAALRYRPARARSFWDYCKGARPLYDDLLIGPGMYLAQTAPPGEGRYDGGRARQFLAARWRGFQKILGV